MREALLNVFNFMVDFFEKANSSTLISTIAAGLLAYLATKYSTTRPQKIKVKQMQLSNVYLPLHRLFEDIPSQASSKQLLTLQQNIATVLDEYYELAFPQLHRLNQTFHQELIAGKDCAKTLSIMKHQIDTDYELLKKSLGYPSENIYSLFIRMTFKQKMNFLFPFIDAIGILFPGAIWYMTLSYLPDSGLLRLTLLLFFTLFFVILMGVLSRWLHSSKN